MGFPSTFQRGPPAFHIRLEFQQEMNNSTGNLLPSSRKGGHKISIFVEIIIDMAVPLTHQNVVPNRNKLQVMNLQKSATMLIQMRQVQVNISVVCKDGSFLWSQFLLAAASDLLSVAMQGIEVTQARLFSQIHRLRMQEEVFLDCFLRVLPGKLIMEMILIFS